MIDLNYRRKVMTSLDNLCQILNLKPYKGIPYEVRDDTIYRDDRPVSVSTAIYTADAYIRNQKQALRNLETALDLIKRRLNH